MSITNLEKLVPLDLDDLQERAQEIVRKFTFAEDHRVSVISRRSDDDEDKSLLIKAEPFSSPSRVGLRRSASLSRLPKEKSPAQRSRLRDGIIWDHHIYGKEHAYILNVASDSPHRSPRPTTTIDVQDAARSHSSTGEAEDRTRSESQSRKMTDSLRRSLSLKSNHGCDLGHRQPTQQSAEVDANNPVSLHNRVAPQDQALGRSKSLIHRIRYTPEDREVDIRTRDVGRVAMSSEASEQKVHPAFRPKPQDQMRIENRNGDIFLVHEYGAATAHRTDHQRSTAMRAHQPQLSLMTDVPADDRRDTLSPILGCKIPGIEMFGTLLDASTDQYLPDHAPTGVPNHDANARRGHKQVASRFHETFSYDDVETSNTRRQTSRPDTPMTSSSTGGSSHYTYAKPTTINYIPIFESPRTAPRPTGIASPPSKPPAVPIPPPRELWNPAYRSSHLGSSPESDRASAAEFESAYTSPRTMRSPPPARRLRSSSSSGRCETLSTIIESRYEHSSAFQGLYEAVPRPALVKSHTLPLPVRPNGDIAGSPTRERDGRSLRAKRSSRRSGVIFDGIIGSFV